MAPPPAVGIDLGTTNSVLAALDPAGRPYTVPNFEGTALTPSQVLIEGAAVTVGREAGKAAARHPELFADGFKRFMGEDAHPHPIDGRAWRPEVLSALVLRRLRADAVRKLGPIDEAVVTVPAYFDEARRRATAAAAEIAGWRAAELLNEPTAAALAYAHRHGGPAAGTPAHVLVYDLGGGTFDVTVLRIDAGREYRAVATDGEVRLGGRDWDDRLAAALAERFQKKTGLDPLAAAGTRNEFLRFVRQMKHTLSSRPKAVAPCACGGRTAAVDMDRAEFERLTADLLNRTRVTAELVLERAKLKWSDLDRVLLVGGSSRMPMVGALFERLTGRPPDATLDADEAVAHGAAVYAGLRRTAGGPKVVNVTAHGYRVLCLDKDRRLVAVPMIARDAPLPAAATRPFPVSRTATTAAAVAVVEGESDDPAACERLGEIVLTVPPATDDRRRLAAVTVTCRADGSLSAAARVKVAGDAEYGPPIVAELVPRKGLTAAQVEGHRQWVESIDWK